MKSIMIKTLKVLILVSLFSCVKDELAGLTVKTVDVYIAYSCKGNCTQDVTFYSADFSDPSKRTEGHSKSTSSGSATSSGKGIYAYAVGEVAKITVVSDDDTATASIEYPEGTVVKSGTGKNISLSFTVK